MPKISIILPAHNAEAYLDEAVRSILNQSFRDFELLLLDDGSTDATPDLVDRLAAADPRIRPFHQPNQRIVATLNHGISLATAPYIAIMHADDIALPTRLEKQLAYLDAHPAIHLCGTWIQTFSTSPTGVHLPGRLWQYPTDPDFIACFLLFWCPLAHPTIIFRASTFADGLRYDPAFNHAAEDYALWAATSSRFKLGNVPEVLLHYREHSGQGSRVFKTQQRAETRAIRRSLLARLDLSPTEPEMDLHQQLSESELESTPAFVSAADAWLRAIHAANARTAVLPPGPLAKVLAGRWAAVCLAAATVPGIWNLFWASPLAPHVDLTQEKNRAIPNPKRRSETRPSGSVSRPHQTLPDPRVSD